MLNWLKSLVGRTDVQNRVGLPEHDIVLLKKDFFKLDRKALGISHRILQYLVNVTDEDVLQEILRLKKAGSALKLSCNVTAFCLLKIHSHATSFLTPHNAGLPRSGIGWPACTTALRSQNHANFNVTACSKKAWNGWKSFSGRLFP